MKKNYQVVAKAILTNRIYLFKSSNELIFSKWVQHLIDSGKYIIITTNQYDVD